MSEGVYGDVRPRESIPQQRIVEKMDDYMSRRDYAGAERHLLYWLEEALIAADKRGELMLRNELVGHFRKTGNRQQAFQHAEEALHLIDELGYDASISAATTYTNVGTAFNAFGEYKRSLPLMEKAKEIYEGSPSTEPQLLGGLYNNMALTCVALQRFDEADQLYRKAIATMANVEHGQLEQAITYLNMADAAVAKSRAAAANPTIGQQQNSDCDPCPSTRSKAGQDPHAAFGSNTSPAVCDIEPAFDEDCEKAIEPFLDAALELLDTPSVPRDGYYAFVCEKCAPVFAYYGYFLADQDLRQRAKAIYERA